MSSRCFGVTKGGGRGIDVDSLGADDLPQVLPRQVGMVVDLGVGRRDQDAAGGFRRREAGYSLGQLLEHGVERVAVAPVHGLDIAQVEPHPPLGDGLDHLRAGKSPGLALAPELALSGGAHMDEAVLAAWISVDQIGQGLPREQGRLVQPMLEPQRLMPPKGAVGLAPGGEDRVVHGYGQSVSCPAVLQMRWVGPPAGQGRSISGHHIRR